MALDLNLTVKIGACNRITLQGSNRRELIVNPNSETVFAVSCSLPRTRIDFADKEGELFKNEIYGSSVFVSSPTEEEEEKKAWPGISRHFLYTTQPFKRPEANRQPVASQERFRINCIMAGVHSNEFYAIPAVLLVGKSRRAKRKDQHSGGLQIRL